VEVFEAVCFGLVGSEYDFSVSNVLITSLMTG